MLAKTTAILILGTGLAGAAPVNFSDGFEGAAIDPFWTVTQNFGTVATSTDQAFAGSRSAKFASSPGGQRDMRLDHVFLQPVKGLFSVYFYDVAPGQQTLYEQITLSNSAQPGWNTGIGTQDFDATCYAAGAAGTGPNQNCGSFPQLSTTNVQRTLGWHLFEINVGATDINMYIDGVLIHTLAGDYSFDQVTLGVFGPGFRPDTVAYFDNFSVNGYTDGDVPEPGTWAMLVIGGLGMAALRPKKL